MQNFAQIENIDFYSLHNIFIISVITYFISIYRPPGNHPLLSIDWNNYNSSKTSLNFQLARAFLM